MKLRSMLILILVVPVVYFSMREIHRFNEKYSREMSEAKQNLTSTGFPTTQTQSDISNPFGEVDSSASVVKDLLNAYREYSVACWADSVWIDEWTLGFTCDTSRTSKKIWHPQLKPWDHIWVSETWIHPEPSFVGFMNFLREKIEGERQ